MDHHYKEKITALNKTRQFSQNYSGQNATLNVSKARGGEAAGAE